VLNRTLLPAKELVVPTLDTAACAALIEALTKVAAGAAQAILDSPATADVRTKADGSPVTGADEAAEAGICDGLRRLAPDVPIVSEERAAQERPTIPAGKAASYFLVDPLDGTREFIAGSDEYTVNIAVITAGVPILGVIAAPATGVLWRGIVGRGAERLRFSGDAILTPGTICARPRPTRDMVIMVSRSHLDARTRAYLEDFPQAKLVPCGSSLKFCRLAEGFADLYPRLAPTRDWDVAAGHAILTAAGGHVASPGRSPLAYGGPELLIPSFIASADPITA
jgi:3'(2'), 5'-bisphosphate nucleotidase